MLFLIKTTGDSAIMPNLLGHLLLCQSPPALLSINLEMARGGRGRQRAEGGWREGGRRRPKAKKDGYLCVQMRVHLLPPQGRRPAGDAHILRRRCARCCRGARFYGTVAGRMARAAAAHLMVEVFSKMMICYFLVRTKLANGTTN